MLLHSILHLSYKNTKLRFLWIALLNIFMNIDQRFLGVTQKYELRVSFKGRKIF